MNPSDLQSLKTAALERCASVESQFAPGLTQNQAMAKLWGKIHITVGILTTLFSSFTAIFTFSETQWLVVTFGILSTTFASCLTFLNPSAREGKRSIAAYLIRTELSRLQTDRIFISAATASDELLDKVTEINARNISLLKELKGLL